MQINLQFLIARRASLRQATVQLLLIFGALLFLQALLRRHRIKLQDVQRPVA